MHGQNKHTEVEDRSAKLARARRSKSLFAFAFLAIVGATITVGVIGAQTRRAATPPPPSSTWTPRISEVIHGGVVTSGIGLGSSATDEASGNLRVQIPNGSTIKAAWLFSSAYNFNGGAITPIAGHRFVRIGEGATAQTRNLEGNGDSTRREPAAAFNGRPSYHLFSTNVTEAVRAARTAANAFTFNVPIAERGDQQASNIWIAGHALVVEYELASIAPRIVLVADGVTPVPPTAASAFSQTLTLPAAVGATCARGQGGYDPTILSMAMALDLAGCDENATIRVGATPISTRAGGADDMTPAATGACFQTGGAGPEALYTVGSFGADGNGRPVGLGADSFENTGGRPDDELWELAGVAPGSTTLALSVFKTVSRAGDTTDIPLVVFQARAATQGNDSDGDRVADAQEGECTRVDTDRDGLPDFLDTDSDNDCSLDSAEQGAARTTVARDPNANCRDTDECTADRCTAGVCSHPPRETGEACSRGVCTGGEGSMCVQCVADANCSGATPYCAVEQHECRACLTDAHCDDQNDCTTNSCREGSCVYEARPAAQACSGGVCNGVAAGPMCVQCVSDAQCGGATPRCDTSTNRCAACINDGQCNDGNQCTTDTCSGGSCAHISQTPGTACSGGVCNGAPTAPACVTCVSDAQCSGSTSHCDVARARCVACVSDGDCNDNNSCTNDACVAGSCQQRPTPAGQTCEAGYCNGSSRCVACLNAGHCNDGVECTVDSCDGGRCNSRSSSRGTSCQGGVCNGATPPMCVACVSDSQCGGNTPRCNTQTSQCVACLNDGQCNDNNACTSDQCQAGACRNSALASGASCGRGVCDVSGGTPACVACLSDAQCGGNTAHCNVAQHACQQCTNASHCDDGNPCTDDACGANGTCTHRPTASGATCPTGFCNGNNACVQCISSEQCADTNACTNDVCAGGRCSHPSARPGSACPSGVCNSAATPMCVACISDAQCSGATSHCNTQTNQCQACVSDGQCNDSNACTTDRCQAGSCQNTALASGASCGRGVCDTSSSTPACVACLSDAQCRGNTAHCNALAHTCQQCTNDSHCDDRNPCTNDSCGSNGTCAHSPTPSGATCPTGFCNGSNSCVQCVSNDQCADTNSCTTDSCAGGRCTHPAARRGSSCANGVCDGTSSANSCVMCLDNSQCSGATACCDARAHQCIACPPPAPPRARRGAAAAQ